MLKIKSNIIKTLVVQVISLVQSLSLASPCTQSYRSLGCCNQHAACPYSSSISYDALFCYSCPSLNHPAWSIICTLANTLHCLLFCSMLRVYSCGGKTLFLATSFSIVQEMEVRLNLFKHTVFQVRYSGTKFFIAKRSYSQKE